MRTLWLFHQPKVWHMVVVGSIWKQSFCLWWRDCARTHITISLLNEGKGTRRILRQHVPMLSLHPLGVMEIM